MHLRYFGTCHLPYRLSVEHLQKVSQRLFDNFELSCQQIRSNTSNTETRLDLWKRLIDNDENMIGDCSGCVPSLDPLCPDTGYCLLGYCLLYEDL